MEITITGLETLTADQSKYVTISLVRAYNKGWFSHILQYLKVPRRTAILRDFWNFASIKFLLEAQLFNRERIGPDAENFSANRALDNLLDSVSLTDLLRAYMLIVGVNMEQFLRAVQNCAPGLEIIINVKLGEDGFNGEEEHRQYYDEVERYREG